MGAILYVLMLLIKLQLVATPNPSTGYVFVCVIQLATVTAGGTELPNSQQA
jgi:hypothetical protein